MKRREFLQRSAIGTGAGLAAGSLLLAGCTKTTTTAKGAALPRVKWKLVSSFPKSLDTIFGAADVLSKRVSGLTGGRFTIRVFAANELVPAFEVLDAVQQGSADIGHSASYYYVGKSPAMAFDTALPFGLDARQHMGWLADGGLELLREFFLKYNIINFPGGNTGVQMGGWFREPLASVADLKGLKMRIPGLGGKVMARLGVNVQNIPGGDIYLALERGAIDATEWVGPYDDEKLGFWEAAKNYYYPGWWEPGPALTFYVNRSAYEELPELYREAITAGCAEAGLGMLNSYDAKNPKAMERLVAKGVTMRPFPDDLMAAAKKKSDELITELCADADFKKIYVHWDKFRQRSNRWVSTAELSYGTFAFRE